MALTEVEALKAKMRRMLQAWEMATGNCAWQGICPSCRRNRWMRNLYARLEPWGA